MSNKKTLMKAIDLIVQALGHKSSDEITDSEALLIDQAKCLIINVAIDISEEDHPDAGYNPSELGFQSPCLQCGNLVALTADSVEIVHGCNVFCHNGECEDKYAWKQ